MNDTLTSTAGVDLTFTTVLIAGHRPNRLPPVEEQSALSSALRAVVERLSEKAKCVQAQLRILTGTAEGTDVIAAAIAEDLSLPLHLISPGLPTVLSPSQLRSERQVWLGAAPNDFIGDDPYAIRDSLALSFADFLAVVWDGNYPQGLNGGTVRLILHAALAMKPVIWVHTNGSIRTLDLGRIDPALRHQLQCHNPPPKLITACFSQPISFESVDDYLAYMLDLIHTTDTSLKIFPEARQKRTWAGRLNATMIALACGDFTGAWRSCSPVNICSYRGPAWEGGSISSTDQLDKVFDRADINATHNAGLHRDATWIVYASSTAAVFAAVAGAIHLWSENNGSLWSITELLLVAVVILLVRISVNRDWHAHWISDRFVAEQLRYIRMGLPILALPELLLEPAWKTNRANNKSSIPLDVSSKELHLIQRTVSITGIPSPPGKSPQVIATRSSIDMIRKFVITVIEDQIDYHKRNHDRHHSAHHVLHSLSMALFIATALAVVAHFFYHGAWLLIFTAFLPSLAAGIHGLSTKLEISRIAEQSASTMVELESLRDSIELQSEISETPWRDWLHLRQLTLVAARVMSNENEQWYALVRHQEPELPA